MYLKEASIAGGFRSKRAWNRRLRKSQGTTKQYIPRSETISVRGEESNDDVATSSKHAGGVNANMLVASASFIRPVAENFTSTRGFQQPWCGCAWGAPGPNGPPGADGTPGMQHCRSPRDIET